MKIKILFALLIISNIVCAQESSVKMADENDAMIGGSAKKRILLFPFEPKFYMSNGADKATIEKLKITQKEFIDKIEMSFDMAMLKELKKKSPSISFLQSSNIGIQKDYQKFLGAVSYEFVPTANSNSKDKNTHRPNGQLTSSDNGDAANKFMNAYINMADKDAMNTMLVFSKKYDTEYLVCINQFEFMYLNNSGEGAAYEKYNRQIKVHYNIMTKSFTNVSHGVMTIEVPKEVEDLAVLESKYLPVLAEKIVSTIPVTKQ